MTASTPGDGELDLDAIERSAHVYLSSTALMSIDPERVLALVAEVRKLREHEAWLEGWATDAVETMRSLRAELASRPAPRVITTREELDALPPESVIRGAEALVYERGDDTDPSRSWWVPADDAPWALTDPDLPAELLWCPPSPGDGS